MRGSQGLRGGVGERSGDLGREPVECVPTAWLHDVHQTRKRREDRLRQACGRANSPILFDQPVLPGGVWRRGGRLLEFGPAAKRSFGRLRKKHRMVATPAASAITIPFRGA